MTSPGTNEQSINVALGEVLAEMRPGWTVLDERNGALEGGGRADILVLDESGWPVVIEAEREDHASAESDAGARLGRRPVGGEHAIETAIALVYPPEFQRLSGEELRKAIRATDALEYALYTGDGERDPERLPESGWLRGSVIELAMLVRRAALPPPRVERLASAFSEAVDNAARRFSFPFESYHGNALAGVLGQTDDHDGQTRRMAMTVLLNALAFHETLAECHYPVIDRRSGHERPVQGLDHFWDEDVFDRIELLSEWKTILDRNYWPVFTVARDLLDARITNIPIRRTGSIMGALRRASIALTQSGFMRSHDLTGTVLQRLIADRAFLATYYTRPEAAALLAGLALPVARPPGGSDWGDAETLASVQIGDFACGTGTLLSAAYSRLSLLHELHGGNAKALHGPMMEDGIFGLDVLPVAVHLTATMLAGAHPDAPFDGERLLTMDYGDTDNGNVAIGSLELLAAETQPQLIERAVARTSGARGAEDVRDIVNHVGHGKFDLVIMNPPFTRNTNHESSRADVPMPAYAAFETSPGTQAAMAAREKRLARGSPADGNAGIASFFSELAHRKLRPDGNLAEVLPLSALSGKSWDATRRRWREGYRDLIAVTVAGAGPRDPSFSSDTGIAECLLSATRAPEPEERPRGTFAVLGKRPASPLQGELIADAIQAAIGNGLRRLDDGPLGTTPLMLGDEYCGHLLDCPLPDDGPWPLVGVADVELAQIAYRLAHGRLAAIGQPAAPHTPVPIAPIGDMAERGPIDRDIDSDERDGTVRGPFERRRITSGAPSCPMLWAHDSKKERQLVVEPDQEGQVKSIDARFDQQVVDERAARIQATATRAHYNRDLQFNSQSLVVAMTERPCIGGRAWPSVIFENPEHEYAFALWSNSTLGLLLHWWTANKTQSGRGTTTVTGIPRIPTLDVRELSAEQHERARDAFEALRGARFLPFDQIFDEDGEGSDPARAALDRALLVDVLGLPESLCAAGGPLETLRRKLAAEPQIHGGKRTRVVFTDTGERTVRRADR